MRSRRQRRVHEEMLTPGNSRLGPDFHGFSIPASATCPGSTPACLSECYALKFLFTVPQNLAKHRRNWERARDPVRFVRAMIAEVRWKRPLNLRIHVSGDFFALAYILAWIQIAGACPRVTFLFYTRSWRIPAFRDALIELASLPNVHGFWSEDRDTGAADLPAGRRCFLMADDADAAVVPAGVLVFRARKKSPAKWVGGSWVCPKEQGVKAKTPFEMTCTTCGHCVSGDPLPRRPGERHPLGLA